MFKGNFYCEDEGYTTEKMASAAAGEEHKKSTNLEQAFESETKRALEIAQERPLGWERLLAVELLKAKLAPIRLRFDDIQKGTSHITTSVSGIEFISWIKSTIQSIQAVNQRLLVTVPELGTSCGSPEKSGEPVMIKRATDGTASCCNDLLRLLEDLHSQVPPLKFAFIAVIKEQMNLVISNFLSGCISEFERFAEELNRRETRIKLNVSLHEIIIQMISDAIPAIETRLAAEIIGERLFAAWDETFDEEKVADALNSLPLENIKALVSVGNETIENLYNVSKKEYDDWVLKGKSGVEQAAKQLLKPGEDIKRLEEFIGKIPDDFVGGDSFESSSVYRKWVPRTEEVKRRLEFTKKILRAKLGFPDIPMEQEDGSRREAIPDDVKMYVWQRAVGNASSVEAKRDLSMTILYQSLEEVVIQHATFNFSAKPAIAPKEVL